MSPPVDGARRLQSVRTADARRAGHRFHNLVAFAILFIGGCNYALPGESWATPVQLVHGVFLNDFLIIAYIALAPVLAGASVVLPNGRALAFSGLIAALGAWGVVSAAVNGYSFLDFGEALKLCMLSAYFLLVVRWCDTRGETFVLRSFLLGIAVGGVINVYYSIVNPKEIILGIPVLWSQNGAGGLLGLSIGLAAWLVVSRRTEADARTAVLVAFVALSGTAISYSKTAFTIAACGLFAWLFVLAGAMKVRRSRRAIIAVIVVVAVPVGYAVRTEAGIETLGRIRRLIEIKFTNISASEKYSVRARYMYFWGVVEVVDRNPLTGVAYSGFYDAITQTASYGTGQMADESANAAKRGEANPHNSFLYYASANGVPGLVLSLTLFVTFVTHLLRSQFGRGIPGVALSTSLSLAYFIYANTLPTLLNTDVMYVPAAVAIAQAAKRHARRAARVRAVQSAAIGLNPGTGSHDPAPGTLVS